MSHIQQGYRFRPLPLLHWVSPFLLSKWPKHFISNLIMSAKTNIMPGVLSLLVELEMRWKSSDKQTYWPSADSDQSSPLRKSTTHFQKHSPFFKGNISTQCSKATCGPSPPPSSLFKQLQLRWRKNGKFKIVSEYFPISNMHTYSSFTNHKKKTQLPHRQGEFYSPQLLSGRNFATWTGCWV